MRKHVVHTLFVVAVSVAAGSTASYADPITITGECDICGLVRVNGRGTLPAGSFRRFMLPEIATESSADRGGPAESGPARHGGPPEYHSRRGRRAPAPPGHWGRPGFFRGRSPRGRR